MAITLHELKSHLWNCSEILRGSAVDRTDWKAYILPLLFFKRICDVWDEETAEAAKLFGDADPVDFPEVHRFTVPEGCHWRDVRETPANIGAAFSRAMREIERANPDTLYRVFGAADWGNRDMLTDGILKDLIDAVIGLAPNIFYGTGLAPAVVVLRRTKPAAHKGKVLIVDAARLVRKGRAQNYLDPEHADQIVAWVQAFKNVEDRAKVVSLSEIESEDWTLNISRYVLPPVAEDIPPLPEAVSAFKTALAEARAAEGRLREVLTTGGWL